MFSAGQLLAQNAFGEVKGEVVDKDNEGIPGVHVYIDNNGSRYQIKTNPEGGFRISAIPMGEYQLFIRQGADTMQAIVVTVPVGGLHNIGTVQFVSKTLTKGPVFASAKKGLKLIDGNIPLKTLTAEDIKNSPVKFDVKKLITSMSTDVRQTEDGSLVFRGARKGDMIYIVDGVKTREDVQVPSVSIGSMTLYTGWFTCKIW